MVGCYIDVITGPGGPKRKFIWSKEIEMSTSRLFNLVVVSALLAVAGLLVQESHATALSFLTLILQPVPMLPGAKQ